MQHIDSESSFDLSPVQPLFSHNFQGIHNEFWIYKDYQTLQQQVLSFQLKDEFGNMSVALFSRGPLMYSMAS